jgi:hypothetical protein
VEVFSSAQRPGFFALESLLMDNLEQSMCLSRFVRLDEGAIPIDGRESSVGLRLQTIRFLEEFFPVASWAIDEGSAMAMKVAAKPRVSRSDWAARCYFLR